MSSKKKPPVDNTGNPFVWGNREDPSCLSMSPVMIVLMIFLTINFAIGIILLCYGLFVLFDQESSLYHLRVLTTNLENSFIVNLTFANPIVWGILSVIPFGVLMGVLCANNTQSANNIMIAVFGVCAIIGLLQFIFSLIPIIWLNGTTGPIVKSLLETSLGQEYIGLPEGSFQSKALSLLWDDLMVLKQCCGVSGQYDFIPNLNFKATAWVNTVKRYITGGVTYTNAEINLPMTCCLLNSPKIRQTDTWYNIQNYLLYEVCPIAPTELNSNKDIGCNATIYSELSTYTTNTFAGLIMMSLFVLICAIVAAVGAFTRGKMKKVEPVAAKRLNTYATTVAIGERFETNSAGQQLAQDQPIRRQDIPVVPLQATATNEKKGLYYAANGTNGQIVRS